MTETEIKSMIDKDLYESILNAFTWEKVREQTNYYYTDKAGITVFEYLIFVFGDDSIIQPSPPVSVRTSQN